MRLFIDSANIYEILAALNRGFVSGITTNPSIIAKEKPPNFYDHVDSIIRLIEAQGKSLPLSVEVFSPRADEMLRQAVEITSRFNFYDNLNVKIPIGWHELGVIQKLHQLGIKINCTACMSYNQAIIAANAGADYVSIFWGRITDAGEDAWEVVETVQATLNKYHSPTQIIVGSIRQVDDIASAFRAGADIVTVPPKFLPEMCTHPQTDKVVAQFLKDFQQWQPNAT